VCLRVPALARGHRSPPRPATRAAPAGFEDREACGKCERGDVPGCGTDENGIVELSVVLENRADHGGADDDHGDDQRQLGDHPWVP
jgi:hypothetical protein